MKSFFLLSLLLSVYCLDLKNTKLITTDIVVEVDLPDSETDNTEIYISDDSTQVEVDISSSASTTDSGANAETTVVTVNDQSGSETSADDAVLVVYEEVGSDYAYEVVEYADQGGNYAEAGVGMQETSNNNTVTTDAGAYVVAGQTYEYEDYYYDESTGEYVYYTETVDEVYVDDYVVSETNTTVNEDGSVHQDKATAGVVGDYGFASEEETTTIVTEEGGYSESEKEFVWWVNSQAQSQGSNLFYFAAVLITLVFAFLAISVYKKHLASKNIVSYEESNTTSYIRI